MENFIFSPSKFHSFSLIIRSFSSLFLLLLYFFARIDMSLHGEMHTITRFLYKYTPHKWLRRMCVRLMQLIATMIAIWKLQNCAWWKTIKCVCMCGCKCANKRFKLYTQFFLPVSIREHEKWSVVIWFDFFLIFFSFFSSIFLVGVGVMICLVDSINMSN